MDASAPPPPSPAPAPAPAAAEAAPDRHLVTRLTVGYLAALTLIVLLSGITHLLLDRAIAQQKDAATLINVAGRQRMLSQRIGMLSADLREGDTTASAPLLAAVQQMERGHLALVLRNDLGISSKMSPAIRALYFDGPQPLDGRVRAFLRAATHFHDAPDDPQSAEDYALIRRESRGELLPSLDEVVLALETESNERIARLQRVQLAVFAIMMITLALEAVLVFRPLVSRMRHYAARVYDMATRDSLTGLPNRRLFHESGDRAVQQADRSGQPLALLRLEIDRFGAVNDTHGHATGNAVLVKVAQILQAKLRRNDLLARLGGEDFAILLPGANRTTGLMVAEKLRAAVEAHDGSADGLPRFTVSIGMAVASPTLDRLDALLAHADESLYGARHRGRNCVVAL